MVMRMDFVGNDTGTDILSSVDYDFGRGGIVEAARELVTGPFVERRMREMGENFRKILEPIPA